MWLPYLGITIVVISTQEITNGHRGLSSSQTNAKGPFGWGEKRGIENEKEKMEKKLIL